VDHLIHPVRWNNDLKMSLSDLKTNLPPCLLIIISFVVYQSTMSPIVYLGDSGELTAAAFSLGIPHGSGYPLYTLLGKIFCLIPIGNVGFRMNLMSVFFAMATLWLVYSLIVRMTSSKLAASVGSLILAFVSVFWFQTVAAEVYVLHVFFVALLIRLLWQWDEKREFAVLVLLVFLTGISFGNHLQTVMLAPAVLFIILSGDRKTLLNLKHVIVLSVFFIVALTIYIYLPVRTDAGAAIHWGDPNTLERFLAHVSGRSHRAGYVLTKSSMEYLVRAKETLWFVWSQFSVILLFSVWGWLKLNTARWRIFYVLVIVFDFIYTIFLNIISLEITPFVLPTFLVLTLLAGVGIGDLLKKVKALPSVGAGSQRMIRAACFLIPLTFMFVNYGRCNQSLNYTAYEHALNIFRTPESGDILFMEGDIFIFPVTYGRIVEKMGKDVTLYDRLNIIFKMPDLNHPTRLGEISWEKIRNRTEKGLIENKGNRNIFYAQFGQNFMPALPDLKPVSYGILKKIVKRDTPASKYNDRDVWKYYSHESCTDNIQRDFWNREVCANYYYNRGKSWFYAGYPSRGLKNIELASRIAYDDGLIHSNMAIFLVDQGFFKEARKELEKAMVHHEDLDEIHNNWGYYYHKIGDYDRAIISFQKALERRPEHYGYHNNLGFSFYEVGRIAEASQIFKRSLNIEPDQPDLRDFLEQYNFRDLIDQD
jgi:tetratricopeptide (TPR) repeat protein